jgi:hypothetical protein
MTARLLLAVLLAAALLPPASALAQQDPFGPVPQAPPEQPAPAPLPQQQDEDEGLDSTQQLLIGVAGIVLVSGIAWAIVRDARRAAPAEDRRDDPLHPGTRTKGSRTPASARVKTGRARAKAARQARKRNR